MTREPRQPTTNPIDRANYVGRGQTYVKHLFLREYLQRLAFKILQSQRETPELLYVDGFSGPWRSEAPTHTDTSFHIALTVLTDVKTRLVASGRKPRIRAIFVEKDKDSFAALSQAVKEFTAIDTTVIFGEFENSIPQIVGTAGGAFVFTFVDPTGWTGLALDRIAPLLKLRGEVLVNVMTNHVNRHLEHEPTRVRFDQFFGDPNWFSEFKEGLRIHGSREEAIRLIYLACLKTICGYTYVGTTRVRFPDRDRTYFHLAYGTRHPAGMAVFREVEKKTVRAQEELAYASHIDRTSEGATTSDLFAGNEDPNLRVFQAWEQQSRLKAERDLDAWLNQGRATNESRLSASLMQHPHVDAAFVRQLLAGAERQDLIRRERQGRDYRLTPRITPGP